MARDKLLKGLELRGVRQSAPQNYGAKPSDLEVLLRAPSLYRTLLLINEYLQVKCRRGFTYDGIKAYAAEKGFYRNYSDRTLDRGVRKLRELGYLRSIEKKAKRNNRTVTIVIFIPTKRFWRVVEEREGLIDDG
ncbi:MAG: hypothetical protein DRO40_12045 [Thermoprotei archaeon]|nr:MAG: hypothetical protein DRO40_12045 [Thermoprotei archaeon]